MKLITLTAFLMLIAMSKFSVQGCTDVKKAIATSVFSPMLATDKWLLNVNKGIDQASVTVID